VRIYQNKKKIFKKKKKKKIMTKVNFSFLRQLDDPIFGDPFFGDPRDKFILGPLFVFWRS
jgi:hypothetical protein